MAATTGSQLSELGTPNRRSEADLVGVRQQAVRRVFPTMEHSLVEIPLTDLMEGPRLHFYPEVIAKGYFNFYLRNDRLTFQAGRFIGLIPINNRVAIDVRPRVPIANLERLLATAEHAPLALVPHTRTYMPHDAGFPSLLDLLAKALISSINEIEANGVLREYRRRTEDTSFPRGRILLGETMRRNEARGLRHRAAASWFEHSPDTAPNRCIKYAVWFLSRRYSSIQPRVGTRGIVFDLNRAYRLFDGVQLDVALGFLSDRQVADPNNIPSTRAYYRATLHLAMTIIRDQGVTFDGREDKILMSSLLINLEQVFEAYLRAVLQAKFSNLEREIRVLDGNKGGAGGGRKLLFDEAPSDPATPDIVIQRCVAGNATLTYPLLVEAKYKLLADRSDINQAIAYAASYRARSVVLVYPLISPGTGGLRTQGRIGASTFYQYTYNLSVGNLDIEESAFAATMRQLLQRS